MSGAEGGLVEVYKADARHAENLEQAMRVLRDGGVTPFLMDHPSPAALQAARGIYPVRIGVPEAEAPKAAEILDGWNRSAAGVVERQTDAIRRDLVLAFPLGLMASLVAGLTDGWGNALAVVAWGAAAWFVAFIVVSNIPGLHEGDRTKPPPAAGPEEDND